MKSKERFELYTSLDLTTYHYKVIFLLMSKEFSQSQIAEILNVKKQNICSVCRDLKTMGIIYESSRLGNSVYLVLNSQPQVQAKGQMDLF